MNGAGRLSPLRMQGLGTGAISLFWRSRRDRRPGWDRTRTGKGPFLPSALSGTAFGARTSPNMEMTRHPRRKPTIVLSGEKTLELHGASPTFTGSFARNQRGVPGARAISCFLVPGRHARAGGRRALEVIAPHPLARPTSTMAVPGDALDR